MSKKLKWTSFDKKIIFSLLATFSLTTFVPAQAQQAKRIPRIGYLSALSPSVESSRSEIIRQALHELGYTEGQDIAIEYRYSEGKPDRAPELAADLVRLKVDMIVVAGGDTWIAAVRKATKTIPIVMTGGGLDPVEAGHVKSLARPGGNVTGLTILNTELTGKRLELLKEAFPKVTRVAVLHDPTIPSNVQELKTVQTAAQTLKFSLGKYEMRESSTRFLRRSARNARTDSTCAKAG